MRDEQGQKAGHEAVYEPRFRTMVTSDPVMPTNTSVLSTAKLYKVPSTEAISQLFRPFAEPRVQLSGSCVCRPSNCLCWLISKENVLEIN